MMVSLRPHFVVAIAYFLSPGLANLAASWCFALLISSSSLSNASGVSLCPAARGRRTFTRSKRTPRISASDPSLAEILGVRLLLVNVLRPLAAGQRLTPEAFDKLLDEISEAKHALAGKLAASAARK